MSNPDSSTPSIQALNLAVKPAGYTCWYAFQHDYNCTAPHLLALAYAADLDKADKQNREVLALLELVKVADEDAYYRLYEVKAILSTPTLPEPVDPDLLEARELAAEGCEANNSPGVAAKIRNGDMDASQMIRFRLEGLRRGRELAKEQDRG